MKPNRSDFVCLLLSGLAVCAATPAALPAPAQAAPPLAVPISATLDGAAFVAGSPVRLRVRLTNTSGEAGYLVDEGRAFDWRPEVDWLGADGLQKSVPARKTSAGAEELREPTFILHRSVRRFTPGDVRSFGPEDLSRLFDLGRRGVYTVRVSNTIFPDTSWKNGHPVVSAPVRFRVQ